MLSIPGAVTSALTGPPPAVKTVLASAEPPGPEARPPRLRRCSDAAHLRRSAGVLSVRKILRRHPMPQAHNAHDQLEGYPELPRCIRATAACSRPRCRQPCKSTEAKSPHVSCDKAPLRTSESNRPQHWTGDSEFMFSKQAFRAWLG